MRHPKCRGLESAVATEVLQNNRTSEDRVSKGQLIFHLDASEILTLATVAQQTKLMKPLLTKNLTGIAGYLRSANVSQVKRIIKRTPPMTKLEMVAAEFQGYMFPPQDTPISNKVRPAVQRKMPRS